MCFLQYFWYIMGYEVCFCGLVWKQTFQVLKIEDFKGWVGEASSLSGSC